MYVCVTVYLALYVVYVLVVVFGRIIYQRLKQRTLPTQFASVNVEPVTGLSSLFSFYIIIIIIIILLVIIIILLLLMLLLLLLCFIPHNVPLVGTLGGIVEMVTQRARRSGIEEQKRK